MDNSFFVGNRERLMQTLGQGALVVLTAYQETQRSNDTTYQFEQEANFWYLCGIEAPDWWLIIDGKRRRSYAVAPTLSDTKQIFDGSLSADKARQISGVDEVIDRDAADALLLRLKRDHHLVYTVNESQYLKQYVQFALNPAQRELSDYLKHRFKDVRSAQADIADLRAIKHPEEIVAMQRAVDISVKGFQALKDEIESYRYEYEAEARLSYEFRRAGATTHAYSPIVGAGENACTLHYVANHDKVTKRSLLLIDAGAKYQGYSADITRTYAFKQPTKRQIEIHQAVLGVQTSCIQLLKPGLKLAELQSHAETATAEALKNLGLYKNDESVHEYFPHAIGHGLGIDVHDSLGRATELAPGMVITIEPGIYIHKEAIGVRIEDDVLVTDSGAKNLSQALSTDLF